MVTQENAFNTAPNRILDLRAERLQLDYDGLAVLNDVAQTAEIKQA